MKNILFFISVITTHFVGFSQTQWRIVSPAFVGASHPNLRVKAVQRTQEFTIFEMSYTTTTADSTYLEICNTFQLVSGGMKLSGLLKAEGAPIADMLHGQAFECEPKAIGRFVPPETEAYFQLHFEALPQDIQQVDLIEFNGSEACEFVIRGIRLPFGEGANPVLEDSVTTPAGIVLPHGERRPVVLGNETRVRESFVDIEIWDNDQEDGDIISLSLNDKWVLTGYELAKSRKLLRLQLQPGANWLMMRSENLGRIPPNTAAIALVEHGIRKIFTLHSDMGKSEVLKLMRE
jgi:hypothetical protein